MQVFGVKSLKKMLFLLSLVQNVPIELFKERKKNIAPQIPKRKTKYTN